MERINRFINNLKNNDLRKSNYDFINAAYSCMHIYNKNFLIENDIKYAKLRVCEDVPFYIDTILKAASFSAINTPLYNYRKNRANNTTNNTNYWRDVITAREIGYKKISNSPYKNLLKSTYIPYCIRTTINYYNRMKLIDKSIEKDFYNEIRKLFLTFSDIELENTNYKQYAEYLKIIKYNYYQYSLITFLRNKLKLKEAEYMGNRIDIIKETSCSGCASCKNICPSNAISMIENNEGFLYPNINEEKCTHCGLCAKACPVLHHKYNNIKKPKSYAVMAPDTIRKNSTSGGVFPLLAYYFLENGGYIAGAIFDNNTKVKHIVSNQKEDIEKMRKSKYLQSEIGNCYKEIKQLLNKNKKVLFTGTPCQIAGLKSYLAKDDSNLYCVEIICHGVPSPKVFKKYISKILTNPDEKFITTDFRDKTDGWKIAQYITTKTTDNTFSEKISKDTFMQLFLKNIILRSSCKSCIYNKIPRQADLTMGDFWGINKLCPEYDDFKGTSVVLVNNKKGNELLKVIQKNAKLCKKTPLEWALLKNPNLYKSSVFHNKRKEFFKNLESLSLEENKKNILNNKADCMIINFWYAGNYGAILTCFGVYCLMKKLGLNTKVINYTPKIKLNSKYDITFPFAFAEKYMDLTTPCNRHEDLRKLNENCNIFITGSDQVFSPKLIKSHCENTTPFIYLLDFVKSNAKKLSYAASFGIYNDIASTEDRTIYKHYLSQFNNISVRESEGVDILKDMQLDGEQLIDGAFHIPMNSINKMIQNYKTDEKYIAYFSLTGFKSQQWINDKINDISKQLELPVKEFVFDGKKSVEEWLAFIKNAQYVVSNSYHAIIFAIRFNIPFVQIKNAVTQDRFNSLFKTLDIENNSIEIMDEISSDKLFINRNWDKINQQIEYETTRAENWMKKAIKAPTTNRDEYLDIINCNLIKSILDKKGYESNIKLILNKNKILREYLIAIILSKISSGKNKQKYNKLKDKLKKDLEKINNLAN